MCYFEQTRWACGYWRWGHFRQQCNKEYRMGETCGLKLVYETKTERDVCKLCHDTEKKQRRYDKMYRDVQRWQREGNRSATIERTCAEMQEVAGQIYRMREEHDHRLQSLGQVSLKHDFSFLLCLFALSEEAQTEQVNGRRQETGLSREHRERKSSQEKEKEGREGQKGCEGRVRACDGGAVLLAYAVGCGCRGMDMGMGMNIVW
ncbi:hypothetical protein FBEOM_10163 [Fusarium beomiforme]|uniref:Uncharacterized protein n=1 Tax=Fusarium beomiforme TaxID=44412 RepID=A0A9P5DSP5_9HYPO|nr:hypothetical protein FBEOM_10163 [Fusarium beomiforme]